MGVSRKTPGGAAGRDPRGWRELAGDGALTVRVGLLLTGAWWAVQCWQPADTLGSTPSYRWFVEFAARLGFGADPERFWAWVFTAETAVCSTALVRRTTAVRFASALIVGVVRGVMAWGICVSNPANPGAGVYLVLAGMAYWLAAYNAARLGTPR